MEMSLSKFWEILKDREAWHAVVPEVAVRHDLATEQEPWVWTTENSQIGCKKVTVLKQLVQDKAYQVTQSHCNKGLAPNSPRTRNSFLNFWGFQYLLVEP